MSEDLLKEINADMRAEKMKKAARRYMILIVVIVFAALTALCVWQYTVWQARKALNQASSSYLQIMQQITPVENQVVSDAAKLQAIDGLRKLSDNSPQSIRALSQLEEAALLANQGKVKEASIIWQELSNDKTAELSFRSLASLLWIQHHLDTANPVDLRNRINKLLAEKTPWTALIKECEALLSIRTGKLIEARQVLGQLSIDMNAPPGVQRRATQLLQIIASNKVAQ